MAREPRLGVYLPPALYDRLLRIQIRIHGNQIDSGFRADAPIYRGITEALRLSKIEEKLGITAKPAEHAGQRAAAGAGSKR
jgi:hypothetical protein